MFAFRHTLLFIVAGQAFLQAQAPDAASTEFFEKKIRPVLAGRCYPCHSASSPKVQGGLWLDSRDGLRKGGNSGTPIVPGDPDASLLIKALRHTDETVKMPPGKPLNPEIVANFERWVRMGAPDPRIAASDTARDPVSSKARDFWSFRKPVMPTVPAVANAQWARTPVDNFILAKLEEAKLTPSPGADKRTLLRRASFDLIGLPPSPQEVDGFLKDNSPNAYEKVVDRLLASPQYGERWGRHWMDVSRYADTADAGARFAFSYTYRDWVIRAFNEDMPYNEFVKKQVAADQMELTDKRDLAALGYITLGRSVPKGEHDMIDDRIDVVTRGLLGMTVTCARCHDHKFDPIPTRDYYSFYGMIANSIEPQEYPLMEKEDENSPLVREYREGMRRRLKAIDDFKVKRHAELVAEYRTAAWISRYMIGAEQASKMSNTEIEKLSRDRDFNLYALRRWRDYLNKTRDNGDPVFAPWHALAAKAPVVLRPVPATANVELTKALSAKSISSLEDAANVYGTTLAKFDSDKPNADPALEQLRLALRGEGTPTNIPLSAFMKIRGPGGDDNIIRGLTDAVRVWQAEYGYRGLPPRAMALEDAPKPVMAHVFIRGNPNNLGVEAPPHFLSILSKEPQPFTKGSGRLELANAIASPENPVTARVIVNRVWQWHFGKGIVGTPSDFGTRGDLPTHPELLDYLAVRFIDDGWSLKKLHKWIMLSSAYRQGSGDRADARAKDPENKLLWRMNRQRLDYESLRDETLFVSGTLDPAMGGLPFSSAAFPSVPRRTVYAYIPRGRLPGEMNAFDFANPETHTPQRFETTVPQQALYLMNSPFIAEQARHLVARPEIRSARDDKSRVAHLYRTVFGRTPTNDEMHDALAYVGAEAAAPREKLQPEEDSTPWEYGMGRIDEKTGSQGLLNRYRYSA
ncbi:MAG: PSD1 and planctomycete cytochrome C domain-containing protein, partial [Acidobacteriota bacterium]|nr:PSD1 and planctomycete cytochrome C domain-containing protein [Acidobacteriota bacterium]